MSSVVSNSEHGLANKLLDLMLLRFQEKNLLKHRGKQRTDSTQVIAAIRQVNRLELVGETLRAALNESLSNWRRLRERSGVPGAG